MGFWKSGIDRSATGEIRTEDDRTNQIKEFFESQEQVEKYDIVDVKNWVVDVEGSILLFESDLYDGELFFKIGKLTGNLYCHCRHFKPSVVPTELGGEIIFVLNEEELAKYRTNTIGSINDDDPFGGMELLTAKKPSKSDIIKRLKTAIADSIDCGYDDIDLDDLRAEIEQERANIDKYKLRITLDKRSSDNIECRIYMSDSDDELKLNAIQKTIYLMFIMHENGIIVDDIRPDAWKMAKKIYDQMYGRVEKIFEDEDSDELYTKGISKELFKISTIRGYISEIREAIKKKTPFKSVIDSFAIEGYKNAPFKVGKATDELREQIRQAFGLD